MAYSTLHESGIVEAYPAGLESTFTFNGLVMNDRDNPDRYRITKISGLHGPEVRDSRDVNPSRHGETAYTSYYSGKQIIIDGMIYAGNLFKLRNMISDLQAAFSDISEEKALVITNFAGQETYINCKKSAPLSIEEEFNSKNMRRNFQITLRASDPFVYSNTENNSSVLLTKISYVGRFYNLNYNRSYSGISALLDNVNVTNAGNFNNLPIIKIYGAVTSPVVINYTTNKFLIFNTEISEGRNYTFDLNKKTIVDDLGVSKSGSLSFDSTDFYLAPGVNNIGFGASAYSGSAELEILYKDTWI